MKSASHLPDLSELETRVMEILWTCKECSADEVRKDLARKHELTDSSIRTILRRLESKGYAAHDRDGKRFIYRPRQERQHVAAAAARKIIDTICGGKAHELLLGLLEDDVISTDEIEAIRQRLEAPRKSGPRRQ